MSRTASTACIKSMPSRSPLVQVDGARPGGAHVMLKSLKQPLRAGMSIPLTLTFQNAGTLTIEVPVESPRPAVADATIGEASKVPHGLFLTTGKSARSRAERPSR